MRNSTMRFANKLCITFALSLLVVCIACFALTGNSSVAPVAEAAREHLTASTVTLLSHESGLQHGMNVLETTNYDYCVVEGSASNVSFGQGQMTVSGSESVTIATKPTAKPFTPTAQGNDTYANLSSDSSVYFALRDDDIVTTFVYSVDIGLQNNTAISNTTIEMTAYYSSNGSASGKIEGTEFTRTITFNAGSVGNASSQSIQVSVPGKVSGEGAVGGNNHLYVSMKVSGGANTVVFTNPSVYVKSESYQLQINQTKGVSLTVTGANRKPVTISNVYDLANAPKQMESLYVKAGDIITLTASLLDSSKKEQEFGYYYAAALGKHGSSCIDWYTYYNDNYDSTRSCLERVDAETHLYYPNNSAPQREYKYNAYQGYVATFKVKDNVSNADTIQIIPRLYKSYDGSHEYWIPSSTEFDIHKSTYQINVKVDNTKPTAPTLDTTKGLGYCVNNGLWYTDSDRFTLDYAGNLNMDALDSAGGYVRDKVSSEFVYAFIVDTSITAEASNYDFTPGTGASYTYTIAGGSTLTTRRLELGGYSNRADGGKANIIFDKPGQYGLVLYAVDSAGNVSSSMVYALDAVANVRKPVKVDSSTMETGAYIKYGDNAYLVPTKGNRSEFTKYAHVYVLIGDDYHDENGVCDFDVNNAQPNLAVDQTISVKRGQTITVRIVMEKAQYADYSLIRYAVGDSISKEEGDNGFVYKTDYQARHIYDVTFNTNDFWNNESGGGSCPVIAYYNRRIDLRLLDDDFTYTYVSTGNGKGYAQKITFADKMQAYFKDTANAEEIGTPPTIAVEYFKPVTLTIQSEYYLNTANQIVLQGGGTITIPGEVEPYDVGDLDQNEFVRGNVPFSIGNVGYERFIYYVDRAEFTGYIDDGGISYACFDLVCYDLKSGNSEGFADAGEYFYRAYIVAEDNTRFYGEIIDSYVIKKADPKVLGAFSTVVLTYGQSFDDLAFTSYYDELLTNPISGDNITINNVVYQLASSGVYGTYVIQNPQIGSDAYNCHSVAKDYIINVAFRPLDPTTLSDSIITTYYETFFKSYYDEVSYSQGKATYALKEGVQTALNYNEVLLSIPVTIEHRKVVVEPFATEDVAIDVNSNSLRASFNGYQKTAQATVYIKNGTDKIYVDDQPIIIEYKALDDPDTAYSGVAPENAGQYMVRFKVDDTRSNYRSDYLEMQFTISKRLLEINVDGSVSEHSILDRDVSVGNLSSNEMLTYTYSHTKSASYVSGYYEGEDFNVVNGLLYNYSFYQYAYYDQNANLVSLTGSSWSEPIQIINASYLNAGRYLMQVEIDNDNNQGLKYIIVDVLQVRRGDVSSLAISTPSVNMFYDRIDLDGRNHGRTANMEYGQTLQSMRDQLLGNGGSAKYTPRGTTTQVSIASRFIFETEEQYVSRIYEESGGSNVFKMDENGYGEKVFPMLYNDQGQIMPYSVRIIWQAGIVEDGTFKPNYNFRAEEFLVPIYIARATADFTEFSFADMIYGAQITENAKFTGVIISHGYEFGASDYTISITNGFLNKYPEGGEQEVLCDFTPSEAMLSKYLPLSNVAISLFVDKRELAINFDISKKITADDIGQVVEGEDNTTYNGVVHEYGKPYAVPAITFTALYNAQYGESANTNLAHVKPQNVVLQFTYLRAYQEGEELKEGESLFEYKGNTYVNINGITPSTPVGIYYVYAEILDSNLNYKGVAFENYFVTKGKLQFLSIIPELLIEYGDNLMDIDLGNVMIANGGSGDYTKHFEGTIRVAYLINDNYVFDYVPGVSTNTEDKNAYLFFTPTGSPSVVEEYNKNFYPFVGNKVLIVDKRDISTSIKVTDLEHVFNGFKKSVTAKVYDPSNPTAELETAISYESDHTNAGVHPVTITIVDKEGVNYRGSITVEMVIDKAPLTITSTEKDVAYNARYHEYQPEYTTDLIQYQNVKFDFDIAYKSSNGGTGLPREIDRYVVTLTLNENNFYITEDTVILNVIPDLASFNGLTQTYAPRTSTSGIVGVTPKYNDVVLESGEVRDHPVVHYTVEYKESGLSDEYWEKAIPMNAGNYDVRFTFKERGFERVYELDMVINKAQAVFIVNRVSTSTYTGEPNPLTVLLPESVTVADYYYKSAGASDDTYTLEVPVNAGEYELRIVIVDNNYEGVAVAMDNAGNTYVPRYVIEKGNLEVVNLPAVSSDGGNVRFNTASGDVTFRYNAGDGTSGNLSDVRFPYDPTRVIEGKWSLITDVSAYRVGERNVEVEFVPSDSNFNTVTATVNINIIQRDISDLITFVDEFSMINDGERDIFSISYEFTAEKIGVTPTLSEAVPYGENIYYTITYAGSTTQPINVRTESGNVVGYPVSVVLSDANYSGQIDNVALFITPAIDVTVVLPDFKNINVGDILDNSYVIEATGGLYINANGKAIQGRFIVVPEYCVEMTKANAQLIEVQFMPGEDVNNVSSPRVNAYIDVNGQDLDLAGATPTITTSVVDDLGNPSVIYGAPLSSYSITIEGVPATVSWANPDKVLNVGEKAEYILTPNDTDVYNIQSFFINLPSELAIKKAEMSLSQDSNVILYEGNAVKDAIPNFKLYNAYLQSLDNLTPEQENAFEIKDFEYTVTSNAPSYVATLSDLGSFLEDVIVYIEVSHPNYQATTFEFRVFVKRLITDFNVASNSKYYDGEEVNISDLGVSLVGTNYLPGEDEIVFKKILLNGKAVSAIRDAGTYTVTIAIDEDIIGENGTELSGSHAGEYTFTYTVLKRDLSENIDAYFINALNERVEFSSGTTYAEYVAFEVDFIKYDAEGNHSGYFDIDASTVLFTHYSENMAYSYGTLPPTDAGAYKVVVSLRNNPYYEGSKTFNYTIKKRVAEISVDAGYYYTYNPLSPVNIVPYVSSNVSSEYVQLTYYPLGSNVGTTEKPVNVGSYSVVINVVNHPNITGSATTRLTISTAPIAVEELPTITSTLKYGSMLKHVGIEGGVAEATGGDVVQGTFAFMYPEKNDLPVGINNVTIVFTPYNPNYSTTTCVVPITVVKARLSIEFISLEKYYTGEALVPDIDLDSSIKRNFSFKMGNLNVQQAVNAGVYEVTVTITDANYEGVQTATFTIHKAVAIMDESIAPNLSSIVYGSALRTGTIEGGNVVYVSGQKGILGTYRYYEEDIVLGDVGAYEGVKVLFTPDDTANYESAIFTLPVNVVKANAVINVSANSFIYGESILSPVFTTTPLGLSVDNSTFEDVGEGKPGIRGTVQRVGTYLFTAYVNDKNYQGEITYAIVVNKKGISVAFYRENVNVDSYTATYGTTYFAKAQIIADTLVGDDLPNKNEIEKQIIYKYVEMDEEGKLTGSEALVPPTKIGYYKVSAVMEHNDYYILEESSTVNYTVTRATVNSIEFDLASLSGQIYGSVSTPIVITSPSNVGYVIEFPGYSSMPTGAGNYSIKVTITDENYVATTRTAMFRINPKPISVENLKAYSKSYDGLSNIEVAGELRGVMSGDEVDVRLYAHTRDNKVNVGVHSVIISGWDLYGLHAKNYTLRDPIYNLATTITNKVITDPNTQSYITSPEGFSSNVTVSFQEVYDTIDDTNFFTQMIGQKATVQVITIKENGLNTVLDNKVKFYVLIPEEYRDVKNLTVEGLGNLEGAVITREGDYVTFYADSSGEIIFYKNDFPYWVIIAGAVVLMIILGGVFALIALPIRRRKRIPKDARNAYSWNQNFEGKEHAFRKQVEQEIVEKKRRWRY